MNTGRFDAIILGWTITQDPDIFAVWHSSQAVPGGLNFIHYKNPDLDKVLEEARSTPDRQRRTALYHQAQEILDKATIDANNYRLAAIQYTDEMLENLSKIIEHTAETAAAKYQNFVTSLDNCREVVDMNRRELVPQQQSAQDALDSVTGQSADPEAE